MAFPSSAIWAIVRELRGEGLGTKVLLRRSGQVRDAAFWRARSRSKRVETIGSHLNPLRWLAIRPLSVAGAVATIAIGAAPTAGAGPEEQLRSVLPAGYGPASCQSPNNPSSPTGVPQSTHALAAVECRDNSLPGGPTYAYYRLYADQNTLDSAFSGDRAPVARRIGGFCRAPARKEPVLRPRQPGVRIAPPTRSPGGWCAARSTGRCTGAPRRSPSCGRGIPTCSSASPKDPISPVCMTGGLAIGELATALRR